MHDVQDMPDDVLVSIMQEMDILYLNVAVSFRENDGKNHCSE
jgi:hypothetical protein